MEVNCKRVIETIAPQQESHDVTEPIGPLFLHYEGISGLDPQNTKAIIISNTSLRRDYSPVNNRKLSSNIYAST